MSQSTLFNVYSDETDDLIIWNWENLEINEPLKSKSALAQEEDVSNCMQFLCIMFKLPTLVFIYLFYFYVISW